MTNKELFAEHLVEHLADEGIISVIDKPFYINEILKYLRENDWTIIYNNE